MNYRSILSLCCALLLGVLFSGSLVAETVTCAECGMQSDAASPFTARITQTGKDLFFCDIGDLLVYVNKNEVTSSIQVKDYGTRAWIDATKASYVKDEGKFRSPMGWGIAAFADKKRAAEHGPAMDYAAAVKAVK